MRQDILERHKTDAAGNPTGGSTTGRGIQIFWQDGPLQDSQGHPLSPNGAFVEGVIEAAKARLEYFQSSKFANPHNVRAINALKVALAALDERTDERAERGVLGFHTP